MKVTILNREAIMNVIEMQPTMEAVENVYRTKSSGEAVAWPTVFHIFEEGQRDMDIRSGYLPADHIFGHKTIGFFAGNAGTDLPTLMATICVFDEYTGAPVGILEGSYITGVRTGAAGIAFEATNDPARTVPESDIIITVTPSREPVIKKEWTRPGQHFSTVGSDMEGKEELDPEIFRGAKVFVDDMEHCIEAGEVEIPVKKGIVGEEDITEIGCVIAGTAAGRTSDEDITIYNPAGMALLDIATAKVALDLAKAKGLGSTAEL